MNAEVNLTIIEPKKGWVPIDFKALWLHRELLYFLAKRDVKVRYKQTVLGGLWAIIQPLFTMLVFSIFFGRLAKVPSDGIPYPVFVYAALVPWTYFANALSGSGNSLVGSANLITKVYFPRLIVPAAASIAGLLDFAIALSILAILMVYYHIMPGPALLLFPFLVVLTFLCAVGVGLWLSALNVQYRDIRYAIPFLIQLWLFLSPVIYPASMINAHRRWLMALNPMAGVIEAYRASLFNKLAVNWSMLGISTIMIIILFTGGLYYFRRMEKSFADLV
jgi:ABC-type polysaccharide/polyol phosphate export systems, permease component